MLTEMRYDPRKKMRYEVYVKQPQSWVFLQGFLDEAPAIAYAQEESKRPDLPYTFRFQNGERINKNEPEI